MLITKAPTWWKGNSSFVIRSIRFHIIGGTETSREGGHHEYKYSPDGFTHTAVEAADKSLNPLGIGIPLVQ